MNYGMSLSSAVKFQGLSPSIKEALSQLPTPEVMIKRLESAAYLPSNETLLAKIIDKMTKDGKKEELIQLIKAIEASKYTPGERGAVDNAIKGAQEKFNIILFDAPTV